MSVKDKYEKMQAEILAAQTQAAGAASTADKEAAARADRLFDSLASTKDFLAQHNYVVHKRSPQVVLESSENEISCTCSADGIKIELWFKNPDETKSRSASHNGKVRNVPEAEDKIVEILMRDKSSDFSIRNK